jgi:hypothetical protein
VSVLRVLCVLCLCVVSMCALLAACGCAPMKAITPGRVRAADASTLVTYSGIGSWQTGIVVVTSRGSSIVVVVVAVVATAV